MDEMKCRCGSREGLSNFFRPYGDHNFYCIGCKRSIVDIVVLNMKNSSIEGEYAKLKAKWDKKILPYWQSSSKLWEETLEQAKNEDKNA